MPRDHKSVTASLCLVIVKTPRNPRGVPKGYVENLTIGASYNNEIVRGVGYQKGRENVPNGVIQADVSWGETHTYSENNQQIGAVPENHEPDGLAALTPITVLFYNTDRGEFVAEVEEVLPNQIGLSAGAQSTIKENFSGTGLSVRLHLELNP